MITLREFLYAVRQVIGLYVMLAVILIVLWAAFRWEIV